MKWRTYKIRKLKLTVGEKRSLHTGIGFDKGCGTNYTGEYLALYWNGVEKFSQITRLHAEHKFVSERPRDNSDVA